LASLPGVARSFEQSDLGKDELAAAIATLAAPGAVVIDDADLLTDCEAGGELTKIITRGAGRSLALVLAGDADTLASGFGGWQADARRPGAAASPLRRPSPRASSSASGSPTLTSAIRLDRAGPSSTPATGT